MAKITAIISDLVIVVQQIIIRVEFGPNMIGSEASAKKLKPCQALRCTTSFTQIITKLN